MRPLSRLLIVATFALAACSGDGSSPTTPTTPTPATLYSVHLDSGVVDSASFTAGTVIPVRVRVFSGATPIYGITVTWSVTTGHGLLSTASTTTDTLGFGTVLWTLGDTVGVNTLSAAAGDGSVVWHVVGIPGSPSTLVRVSDDSSVVVAGATVPLTARVIDRHGNPVKDADVTWTSSAGEISAASVKTGGTGNAVTNFTAPATAGVYTVTATLPGRASITFTVSAI